jgi:excisionase family DNA binding protein
MENCFTLERNYGIVTVEEAAEFLRVHRTTVSRLMNGGQIKFFEVGTRKMIRDVDLYAFIDKQIVEDSKGFALMGGN